MSRRDQRWRHVLFIYRILQAFVDPKRILRAAVTSPRYAYDWRRYNRLSNGANLIISDANPQLHDRQAGTEIDSHYFYANAWAMRRIVQRMPGQHIDIGSQTAFASLLSAVVPVVFVDYRPLKARVSCLSPCGADILNLPFATGAVKSISCLHVAEHIGLGRYGDPLNPEGTKLACAELQRVLAPNGHLYFAVPIGVERTCFNAHRIHSAAAVAGDLFGALKLNEFSCVDDDGRYVEGTTVGAFERSDYACGLFWFEKPPAIS